MALKEGRCTNCGSILFLDPSAQKGHCLFCDAVFENKEAFRAADDPDAFEFPNVEQPKYEGPSLDPRPVQQVRFAVPTPAKTTSAATQQPTYVVKQAEDMPDLRIPTKAKITMIVVLVIVVGGLFGIGMPMARARDHERSEIAGV